jgi:3-hydroxyisobutyrate dehydrogenase-like beta-hydroxyacid dehydrogenase
MRLHFIGVGKMGLPMALHLRAAGHDVSVTDVDALALGAARERGLDALPLAEGLAQAAVVFSSLPNDQALQRVAADVAASAGPGAVYVDTSTVSPVVSASVEQAFVTSGVSYLRCTVSGNNKMAEAATLTVMGSGPRAAWDSVLPLLQCWGPHQFYLGDAEQARLMKLVVNLMIVQTSAMLAEALTLGQKGGLDWQDMWRVLGASAVASPIVRAKSVQLAQRDFTPTFTVAQMIKDLRLILDAGETSQVPLAQTSLTLQWMQTAVAQGYGLEDYAAVIKTLERSAGLGD